MNYLLAHSAITIVLIFSFLGTFSPSTVFAADHLNSGSSTKLKSKDSQPRKSHGTELENAIEAASRGHLRFFKPVLEDKPKSDDEKDRRLRLYGLEGLSYAASHNHHNILNFLLEEGVDPNRPNHAGFYPIHWALKPKSDLKVGNNDLPSDESELDEMIVALINARADIHVRGPEGETLLHLAAGKGYAKILQRILKEAKKRSDEEPQDTKFNGTVSSTRTSPKVHVDEINCRGYSPLALAALEGHLETVKILLNNKAQVNLPGLASDKSHLQWATLGGDKDVVQLLIAKKAQLDSKSITDSTALHVAASLGYSDIVQLLTTEFKTNGISLDLEANSETPIPNQKPNDGTELTPLYLAASMGHLESMKVLIAAGARFKKPVSIVRAVVHKGNPKPKEVWQLLSKQGYHEDILFVPNERGDTAFHLAAISGNLLAIQFLTPILKARGLSVDQENRAGVTALMKAAKNGHLDIVDYLISQGADPDYRNTKGKTALTVAVLDKDEDMAEIVLARMARDEQTPRYAKHINAYTSKGLTHLQIAVKQNNGDLFEKLYLAGADPDLQTTKDRKTALHIAVSSNHLDMVLFLLAGGANRKIRDAYDETPKELAIRLGKSKEIIKLLKEPYLPPDQRKR